MRWMTTTALPVSRRRWRPRSPCIETTLALVCVLLCAAVAVANGGDATTFVIDAETKLDDVFQVRSGVLQPRFACVPIETLDLFFMFMSS